MDPKNKKNKNWTQFGRYLYKYRRLQAVVILLGAVTTPLSIATPYITKVIIDRAYGNRDLRLFLILAAIVGIVCILNSIIGSLSSYLSEHINRSVRFDMTRDMFRHLQSFSMSFFSDRSTGEHIFRMSSDVSSAAVFICNTIPQAAILFPRLLFILIIVFYLNWKLALLTTILVPVSYIHPYFFGKWLREIACKMIEISQDIFRGLQEVFSHIHLVKALGKEAYEIKRFEKSLTKRIEFDVTRARLSSANDFSNSVVNKAISGIVVLYGGYHVIKGDMTLGSLTAIMIYLSQLIGVTNSIGRLYKTIIVNSVSCQRLAEIMDVEPLVRNAQGAINYRILRGSVEFKDASFGYKENDFILRGINFLIKPASRIALVGPSGCGKTTLLNLILRLYELNEGCIVIDGLDTRGIKLESLKREIGVALQDPFLWDDTAARNILYGAEDACRDEAIKAAKIAEAHNFILELSKQYDTAIGEMACKISEGQKQRIAIARAVIKKPKILILDEAMSSLDSETEGRIIDNIIKEFRNSTIIVVSHRLSAVKKMELVYFLESPGNMAVGRHGELIKLNPGYRELFAGQAGLHSGAAQRVEEFMD